MLWLACHFPLLALEAPPGAADVARVAVEGAVVAQACPLARAAGVMPGMRLATARALISPLEIRHVDAARRHAALTDLAPRLAQLTSQVVLEPAADALLGELGGSLRILDGLAGARRAVRSALADSGTTWQAAIAPTPAAAVLLAIHRPGTVVTTGLRLRALLTELPAATLPLPPAGYQLLRRIGARTIADVLALPRAGLARRLGLAAVTTLERLLGERPDPRETWTAPLRFERTIEWDDPLAGLESLQFPLRRLLGDMAAHVACRSERATAWSIMLVAEGRQRVEVPVAAAAGSADPAQLLSLSTARLAGASWPGPVVSLYLRLDATRDAPGVGRLFDDAGDEQAAALLDRLRARLGSEAVYGLATVADPRPERAQRRVASTGGSDVPATPRRRPAWLLQEPLPWCGDRARLLAGPERLESGWWDTDARRDYYIARGAAGETLWVYQDMRTAAWFVQGWFG